MVAVINPVIICTVKVIIEIRHFSIKHVKLIYLRNSRKNSRRKYHSLKTVGYHVYLSS